MPVRQPPIVHPGDLADHRLIVVTTNRGPVLVGVKPRARGRARFPPEPVS
jgi:ribosomal protein L22